jgi:DNA polymerase-3 subunit beta
MKTIVQAQDLGSFSIEDGSKLTFRQALKENDLNPKEWRLSSTYETKTTITYTVIRKAPEAALSQAAPLPSVPATDVIAPTEAANSTDPASPVDPPPPPPAQALLTLPRKDFEQALKVACDFAAPRTTLPILTNVRLASDGASLTIYATDLECCWTRTIPLSSGVPVTAAVYASILYSEVKALETDVVEVLLAIDDEARTISVNGRCSIHTSDPEEFPEPPAIAGPEFSIPEFPARLKAVEPAISTDQTRYMLTGAQIDFAGGKIVATDGFRLHHQDIRPVTGALPILLPHRAVKLIIKHGGASTITVDGTDERKYISYPLQGGAMIARLLEGNYPDWRNVLPEDKDLCIGVKFDAKEFFKIVEGVIPIAGAKSTVSLTVNGSLSIETEGDCGRYHWQIPCDVTGKGDESYTRLYNLKYLTDALKSFAGDGPALLEFPVTFGATRVNSNAVVMPIRA